MPELSTFLPAAFALGLALVHLFAGRLTFLDVMPRSRWLSLSGGSAVAYVFVHILPEIQSAGTDIDQTASALVRLEHHVYLIALLGFTAFYGIEQYVRKAKARGENEGGSESHGVFWVHIGTFTLYNVLIGYLLLHREESGVASLAIFFVAMALHFFVNDYGLREYHGSAYRRYGR
ncbi:ZIP family metal transporter [Haloarcula amylovorans]|uniref:ZIP family metal transporter n=1 Tax=Haloarcula amylovorans TaxID=2562280 RepID=UPI001FD73D49|nr:ZIP family metal transporter [Halomicroarcula amylolytica]